MTAAMLERPDTPSQPLHATADPTPPQTETQTETQTPPQTPRGPQPQIAPKIAAATAPTLDSGIDRIVLTGFMGSGKTTVGALLAHRLGWAFLDLDREIERRAGQSVPALFATAGEAHFRQLETAALASLLGHHRLVLALGGGAADALGNRLLLEQTPHTAVVYLAAPLDTLLARCTHQATQPGVVARPLLSPDPTQNPTQNSTQLAARFAARHPLYQRIAAHHLDTASLSAEAVTQALLDRLS